MKSKINFAIAIFIVCIIVFHPTPAQSFLTLNSNYLISGSIYLRRTSWVDFRLSSSPTTLWQNDLIKKRAGIEAVVLCSDFSRRNISSFSELKMNIICPVVGRNNQPIENEGGNILPTSQGDQNNENLDYEPKQFVEIPERLETERSGISTSTPAEVSSAINRLNEIRMSDSTRAFVTAQIYRSEGLLTEAISLLKSILAEGSASTNEFQTYANYQLLGDLYTEIEQYDEAKNSYSIVLANILDIELSSLQSSILRFGEVGALLSNLSSDREITDSLIESKAETLLALGRISLANNDYQEAIASLTEARRLYVQLEGSDSPTVRALNTKRLEEIIESANAQAEELRDQIEAQDITDPRRIRNGNR